MADNFDMKKFLTENQIGPYAKAKLKTEEIGGDIGDAEAEKEMDFLAEYEVIYQWEGSKCYRIDDEGNRDEVNPSYCQRFAEGKEEEAFGGINEMLEPHVYERMYNLSNIKAQQAMIKAAEILMNDLTAEGFEVPEIREFFTQLIANDI